MRSCITWIVLLAAACTAMAATPDGMPVLVTGATDGGSWDARFAIGLSVDGGASWQSSATLSQPILIRARLEPAPAHVGQPADVYVIGWRPGRLAMLTPGGAWVSWSGEISELQAARASMPLAARQEVTLYEGKPRASARYQVFMGYRPVSGSNIIYTAKGAAFDISADTTDPQSWFTSEIFEDIVLPRCALCHVDGGVAGNSGLHFIRDARLAQQNFDIFEAFYRQQLNGYDYVLGKVSGGVNHGGGAQLPLGGTDYQKMATLLALIDGATDVPAPGGTLLFNGVRDQSAVDTLRDAALLLAGRLPTAAETVTVAAGGDDVLRNVLLQLMKGDHFHAFLKDAANDRLFLRGDDSLAVNDCDTCFPALNAEYWRLQDAALASGAVADQRAVWDWTTRLNYSVVEAPLELIAYVVENDRPYSEILTADYEMLTPLSNAAFGGTAEFPANARPVDFRPGRIRGYYLRDATTEVTPAQGFLVPRMVNPGNLRIDYPHVGVLNSKSFLGRYPSTATNRNRARARWTYYNFLGVDIEALAARTTDPIALADTNNPTMNNPACAVCHSVLDPMAGIFQDYDDQGVYRSALNGTDSLDRVYKSARGTPYRKGDTWYADMRAPGFEGAAAPTAGTMRWLAETIVQDRRFASATVRFWWPALMGAELLKAPEVTSDSDYAARLMAHSEQQAEVEMLADRFVASGLSLKQLLADMVLSRWYRSERLDTTNTQEAQGNARAVAGLTGEKLLTPEQLARKTRALTGFNWNGRNDSATLARMSGLEGDYNTFYGGIDSFALKVRARTITPLMSNVALTHALEASCPIVLGDFIRPEAERLLFGNLSPEITPLTEAATTHTMNSSGISDVKAAAMTVVLQPGAKTAVVSLLNDACTDVNGAQCRASKNLVIASVAIRAPNGQTTTLSGDSASHRNCAAATAGKGLTLYSSCTAEYAFTAPGAGSYTITANLAAQQAADDPVLAGLNIEANLAPASANTHGAIALKNQLIEMHRALLGQNLTLASPELLASYDLLLQTWQERRSGNFAPALLGTPRMCDINRDVGFIETLPYPGAVLLPNGRYDTAGIARWLTPHAQDPLYMKQSWVVVMAYLLSHYDYLHE